MFDEILNSGGVAVVTGAADGIGLAAAKRFAASGLHVVASDLAGEALDKAVAQIGQSGAVTVCAADVTNDEDMQKLADTAFGLGQVVIVMNNAGIGVSSSCLSVDDSWSKMMAVNFFGVLRGVGSIVPRMVEQGTPGVVINTGSKQGITSPPGNPGYNATKAAVKILTEQLAHELRQAGSQVTAHLLVPGFTYTGMIRRFMPEKPDAAWTAEQVVDYLFERLARGDFYILCPDNDVTEAVDRRRVAWAAGDIIENRPALSRWHPDYEEAFRQFQDKD